MTGSIRTQALRRAAERRRERRAAILAAEADIETAVADFVEARLRAQRVRDRAAERAARLVADAEQVATGHETDAAKAVTRLKELGQTRTAIAALCGITETQVRALLTTEAATPAAEYRVEPAMAEASQ